MDIPFLTHRHGAGQEKSRTKRTSLGLDFHNHILPGVDDGVSSVDQAWEAITALQAAGFTGAVITPHIYNEVFNNSSELLRDKYDFLIRRLGSELHEFPLYLAAEYFADEHFLNLINQDDILYVPVGNERWVLLEFPYYQKSPCTDDCLSALVARGYRPVIAHVERYRYVAAEPGLWLPRFQRAGAILQGDIGSIVGQHGSQVKRFAGWLSSRNLLTLWGTDLHRPSQMERYILPGLRQLPARLNVELDPLLVKPNVSAVFAAIEKILG